MATALQFDANRQNALRSTGPRTIEGKETAQRNALRHGLTSKTLVLSCEDREAFEELRTGLLADWAPQGQHEEALVEALVEGEWRLMRCRRTETAFLEQCIKDITTADPSADPEVALALVFADPVYAKKMSLFLRYQSAIERARNQAFNQLWKTKRQREESQPPSRPTAPEIGFVSQSQMPATIILPMRPNLVPPPGEIEVKSSQL